MRDQKAKECPYNEEDDLHSKYEGFGSESLGESINTEEVENGQNMNKFMGKPLSKEKLKILNIDADDQLIEKLNNYDAQAGEWETSQKI